MKNRTPLTKSINPVRNSLNRSARLCGTVAGLLIPLVLASAWFALAPQARAVCQEGCDTSNQNTFLGDDALVNNTTGVQNTATGAGALLNNTTGSFNTANGAFALFSNIGGDFNVGGYNTATGSSTLMDNTTGYQNTATGANALTANTTGNNNTAHGFDALFSNTTGEANTASGAFALLSNTIGTENTATGGGALQSNTTGELNTANGFQALYNNTTGNNDTANGFEALLGNTTGNNNTANGEFALKNNTTGSFNIALGSEAGINLTTGNYNIDIGNAGFAGESKTIRIGTKQTQRATFIAGISGATVANGVGVIIDNNGHLGTVVSSARYKDDMKPMDKASEAILALKPVTFHYKKDLDPEGIPQFGLVAEQVEKVNPDLVARDEDGKPYTVRYEAVNAMLLNEFLKEHRKVEKLEATVVQQQEEFQTTTAEQQREIKALTARLEEQASQIRKVSAQLEMSRRAQQMLVNNQ
jgi:hypothetical protein